MLPDKVQYRGVRMRYLHFVIVLPLILGGCASNDAEIKQLKSDVKQLQAELQSYKSNQYHDVKAGSLMPLELNIQGLSYGGIVRAEASMDSPKITSLKYGEKVILLERTAELKDSYYWFKVRSQSGTVGYQWGGLLCSFSNQSVGAFKLCANF